MIEYGPNISKQYYVMIINIGNTRVPMVPYPEFQEMHMLISLITEQQHSYFYRDKCGAVSPKSMVGGEPGMLAIMTAMS